MAKERAERAMATKLADENFNKTMSITQGNVLNGGAIIKESYETTKNILAKQNEVLKTTGKHISEYDAMKQLEAEGTLRTQGKKKDETGKTVTDEGAVVGRTINQIDNLGKVVGGSMAIGFNKLNTELGHTIATQLPNFNAKLKSLGTPEAFTKAAGNLVSGGVDSAASAMGIRKIPSDENTRDLLNKGPLSLRKDESTAPANDKDSSNTKASDTNQGGILNEIKDLWSQLNTKMGNIEANTKTSADLAQKQVRATENLSGNRLN